MIKQLKHWRIKFEPGTTMGNERQPDANQNDERGETEVEKRLTRY